MEQLNTKIITSTVDFPLLYPNYNKELPHEITIRELNHIVVRFLLKNDSTIVVRSVSDKFSSISCYWVANSLIDVLRFCTRIPIPARSIFNLLKRSKKGS